MTQHRQNREFPKIIITEILREILHTISMGVFVYKGRLLILIYKYSTVNFNTLFSTVYDHPLSFYTSTIYTHSPIIYRNQICRLNGLVLGRDQSPHGVYQIPSKYGSWYTYWMKWNHFYDSEYELIPVDKAKYRSVLFLIKHHSTYYNVNFSFFAIN